jgi:purine-binding chemotaxis protein CheW
MTTPLATLDDALALRRDERGIVDIGTPWAKMVVFELGGSCFALPGAALSEILPYTRVFPIPGCPEVIEGAINVRGDIESVIRLSSLLGLHEVPAGRHTSILLARGAALRSGLRVDQVVDVVDVAETAIDSVMTTVPAAIRSVAAGTFMHQGRACTLLDVELIFEKLGTQGDG